MICTWLNQTFFQTEFKEWNIERNNVNHEELLHKSNNKKGCIRKKALNLEPEFCPPDILHMKKGIISKLLNQVVDWVVLQGKEKELISQMKEHKIPFT